MKVRQTGLQLAVPSWMLDEAFCRRLVDEARPRVAVAALLDLSDLLASQAMVATSKK